MLTPTITGPVEGGAHGRPWSTPLADLASRNYVIEEFFVEGEASSYRPLGGVEFGSDGRWDAEVDDKAPFKTRIVIVHPASADAFNGTVIVSWLNVTAGYELGTADDDELLSGYAWVGVSAQKVGIDGVAAGAPAYSGRQAPGKPLKTWDPERYGSLVHPGDRYSFDIFTQTGRAAASAMRGFVVDRLVATGASQSGARLTTYINAVHPLAGEFDGFMPTITAGWGTSLGETVRPPAGASGQGRMMRPATRLRDDIDEPVFVVNSEFEAIGMYTARRDDSDRFRFWEVAGAPHAVAVAPPAEPRPEGKIDNPLLYRPVLSAAYRHVHNWLKDGTAPPSMPRLDVVPGREGTTPTIERDSYGNALGGIRLPELAAPIAEYHGMDDTAPGLSRLYGWARPFTRDELRSLYPSRDAYAAAYRKGVDDLVAAGGLRPDDVPGLYDQAEKIAAGLDS